MEKRQQLHHAVSWYLCMGTAFLLPFKVLVPQLIALLMVNWLLEGNFRQRLSGKPKKAYLWLFISFFLLHVLALVYTNNFKEGFSAIEVKLSIMVFPLLFYSTSFSARQFIQLLKAFIAGCVTAMLFCLIRAGWYYFSEGVNYFFYMDLSCFMHPGYFSMYLSMATFLLLFYLFRSRVSFSSFAVSLYIGLIIFISLFIVLLSAKLGMMAHFALLLLSLIMELLHRKKYLLLMLLLVSSLGGLYSAYRFIPAIHGRFSTMISATTNNHIDKTSSESTTVRILIWGAATDIIKEKPLLGFSPGDCNDRLYAEYKKKGYTGALEHRLNTHNQYLQTLIGLGLAGLLLLLSQFIFPLIYSIRYGYNILLLFLILTAVSFFTESMLQTQAGVIFYAFFNSLLLFYNRKDSADGPLPEDQQSE